MYRYPSLTDRDIDTEERYHSICERHHTTPNHSKSGLAFKCFMVGEGGGGWEGVQLTIDGSINSINSQRPHKVMGQEGTISFGVEFGRGYLLLTVPVAHAFPTCTRKQTPTVEYM